MAKILSFDNKLMKIGNGLLGPAEPAPTPVDPLNPLNLPQYTIRVKMKSGSSSPSVPGATVTAVQGQTDVYDIYGYRNGDWGGLLSSVNVVEVLGANSTGITAMDNMLSYCTYLTTVQLFDTSSVTNMSSMFNYCTALTAIPLFDTSSVTNMNDTFNNCTNVESGALAIYNQASTQTTPPSNHQRTFYSCGTNTTTGTAEYNQIPSGWK